MVELCDLVDRITGCGGLGNGIPSKDPKAQYSRITISLNESFTDKEYHLAGSFLAVVSVIGSASCTVKLDYTRSGVIDLREVKEVKGKFDTLYISTDGTGGEVILYICQSMETVIEPETKTAYTGQTWSAAGNTSDNVQRVLDASSGLVFEQLIIRNAHFTNDCEIGEVPFTGALPDRGDFTPYSFRLIPKMQEILTKVNPASIGFCSTTPGAAANLKVIGVFK